MILFTTEAGTSFISDALGIPATKIVPGRAGDHKKISKWIYESPMPDSKELSDHIAYLVNVLESRQSLFDSVRDHLEAATIFCFFSSRGGQGSAELSVDLISRLSKLRVDIVIDLYPPCD